MALPATQQTATQIPADFAQKSRQQHFTLKKVSRRPLPEGAQTELLSFSLEVVEDKVTYPYPVGRSTASVSSPEEQRRKRAGRGKHSSAFSLDTHKPKDTKPLN